MANDSTRDRVRALVREVLAKAGPESGAEQEQTTRFVNTVPESPAQNVVTRDESAKSVITEDYVRGLEAGAVLRIGEDARLTPLAADIVSERKIEIVRRSSRTTFHRKPSSSWLCSVQSLSWWGSSTRRCPCRLPWGGSGRWSWVPYSGRL